jgi:hypothetical protein
MPPRAAITIVSMRRKRDTYRTKEFEVIKPNVSYQRLQITAIQVAKAVALGAERREAIDDPEYE